MKIPTLIVILLMFVGGCQNMTPQQQLTTYDNTAAVIETALVVADQQKAIPAKDRAIVAAALQALNTDLAAANNANPAAPAFPSLLSRIQADLNALAALKAKYPAITTQPTTKGS